MAAKIIEAEKPLHPPNGDAPVTMKCTGNITEVSYAQRDCECNIRKLDKDHYIALETGEVKDFQHGINRASNLTTVAQSLRNLRDIINTNVTEPQNCLWVTLTYAENMTDHRRLYQDFRKFWMRFSNYLKKSALPPAEYIVAMEPQGRGAWHAHLIIIFQQEAPYIPNAKIAEIWGFGFVKTRPLTNIDNVGLYLTAYLADMDVTQALQLPGGLTQIKGTLKGIQSRTGESKAIIKGGRLYMYPVGFRIFRYSKGIHMPEIRHCTEAEAMEAVQGAALVYEKTIVVNTAEGNCCNTMNYRQYNSVRKVPQKGSESRGAESVQPGRCQSRTGTD